MRQLLIERSLVREPGANAPRLICRETLPQVSNTQSPMIRTTTLACLLAIAGCGTPHEPVHGTVTLDDEPLPGASISFISAADENAAPLFGHTDEQGRYQMFETVALDGVPPGVYRVRISTFDEGNPETDPPMPVVRERVPKRYNVETTLTAEISTGENRIDFPLTSDGEINQPRPRR